MEIVLTVLAAVLLGLFIAALIKSNLLERKLSNRDKVIEGLKDKEEALKTAQAEELAKLKADARAAVDQVKALVDQQISSLKLEAEQNRKHYEAQVRRVQAEADLKLKNHLAQLETLRKYQGLLDAESETRKLLAAAVEEAESLKAEAAKLVEQARLEGVEEKAKQTRRSKELEEQAEALLDHASREARRIIAAAEANAKQVAGDAYVALREKHTLEQALEAIRNTIDGYGDRYLIPNRSVLDDLASHFGHTAAGEALRVARLHSSHLAEQGQAAECDYVESVRRETAIRFVTVAFNGRVEAILSRVEHDNLGMLRQEILDAFSMINLHGQAFKNARILPTYLDARLNELKLGTAVEELERKEKEEQRRIREQIREEEKVRRELERAVKEAEDEEAAIKKAMEQARLDVAQANAQERAKFEAQLAELSQRLAEAEAKEQRALSMAQQTRAGTVYIISNIGSFGEGVFKIGLTRRLDPYDRIWELGDASVPFDFDVHAMIQTEDAPKLENDLHKEFDDCRVNMVNFRKEFFRIPMDRLKAFISSRGDTISFTMVAEAHEYRESVALNRMSPQEREKYHLRRELVDAE